MSSILEFFGTQSGILFSLALFLVDQSKDLASLQFASEKDDQKNIIRDYIEWCRRQDHESVVKKIEASRETLLEKLDALDNIERLLARISEETNDIPSVAKFLVQINRALSKPVLSLLPLDCRNVLASELSNRDAEIAALESASEDVVLSGQPGVGKTQICYELSRRQGGRFVISDDPDEVVARLARGFPPILIVDDAADRLNLVKRLAHARIAMGIQFRMIVVCWSYEEERVLGTLSLSSNHVLCIPLMSANEIVNLVSLRIQHKGFVASDSVVREIRRQADGRPGLATRLVDLIVADGNLNALVDARAHYEALERAYSGLEVDDASGMLAALAVGGKDGMRLSDVANLLERPIREVRQLLRALATGGVVAEKGGGTLAVIPASFRHALLRREWLTGDGFAQVQMYKALFWLSPNVSSAMECLIGAMGKGALIDVDFVLEVAIAIDDEGIWTELAWIENSWYERVLTVKPELFVRLSHIGLRFDPQGTLLRLIAHLNSGVDSRSLCSVDIERRIQNWIVE